MSKNELVAALERTTEAAMASGKPLALRLQMIADDVRTLSPVFAGAVDAFVGKLLEAEAGSAAPKIGEKLQDFLLPDQNGRLVSSKSLLAEGPLVVAFLRGHWCPYCRITAGALGEIAARARAKGAGVVAITPESRQYTKQLVVDTKSAFPVLSDVDNAYAFAVNLAIWVDEEMARLIAGAGWNVDSYQGNDTWFLPIPAIFVLSHHGVVLFRHVNPDYRVRADLEEALLAIDRGR